MDAQHITRFASATLRSLTPLPTGPTLELPGGLLGVYNGGQVLVHGRWVVSVGIAEGLFIVLGASSERHACRTLLEQLTGYLCACGAEVLRGRIRFPLAWHDNRDLGRTILFWVHRFVGTLSVSLEARLDLHRPNFVLPIADLARQARKEWLWIQAIMRSIEDDYTELLPGIEWLLWDISHAWEIRWSLTLRDAEHRESINLEERAAIEQCDRTWVVLARRHLEPRGYRLLSQTLVRLL